MRKLPRDPTEKLLHAYYQILNGAIIYNGSPVYVGTRIPTDRSEYVYLFMKDLQPMNTGDQIIYNAYVGLQIVSMQGTTEGDDSPVHDILDQVLELVGDKDQFIMNGWEVQTSFFDNSNDLSEMTETNFNITRELTMFNIIEMI